MISLQQMPKDLLLIILKYSEEYELLPWINKDKIEPFSLHYICQNENAFDFIRKVKHNYIKWSFILKNAGMTVFINEKMDTIIKYVKNPSMYLIANPNINKINNFLKIIENDIGIFRKKEWRHLVTHPKIMLFTHIVENNLELIKNYNLLGELQRNENAIDIIEKNFESIVDINNLCDLCKNTNIMRIISKLPKISEMDVRDKYYNPLHMIAQNSGAIQLIEENIELMDFSWICRNKNAVHIIKNNIDKIDYHALCYNTNPEVIELIDKHMEKNKNYKICSSIVDNKGMIKLIEKYPKIVRMVGKYKIINKPYFIEYLKNKKSKFYGKAIFGNPKIFESNIQKIYDVLQNPVDKNKGYCNNCDKIYNIKTLKIEGKCSKCRKRKKPSFIKTSKKIRF